MKPIILPLLFFLFCSSFVIAQSRYDQLMSEGTTALEAFEYSKAIRKFKAAKIGSDEMQTKEADKQIELANEAFIKAIQQANEETKLALEQSKLEAKISEANRLAFMANQYVEKENYEEAFQIASIAMTMVGDDPTNLVEKAFGDAGFHRFSKELENTNAVVLDIQNATNGNILIHTRNKAPLLFDQSGALINRLDGHEERIIDLTISPLDNSIATCSEDGLINFWDKNGNLSQNYKSESTGTYAQQLIATATGDLLAVFNDNSLKVFDKNQNEIHQIQETHKITSVTSSADGKLLLTCTVKGLVKLWDASTMTLIKELINSGNYIHQAIFSIDGSKVILAPEGQAPLIFNKEGKSLATLNSKSGQKTFFEVVCAPDQETIALAAKNGNIEIWNLNGQFLKSVQRETDQRHMLSFSPDSKKILSIDKPHTFVLWELNEGKAVYFDQHKDGLNKLIFSPDGQYILSASKDYTAKLWKRDGSLVMNLDRHTADVRVALFAKDGQHIITGGADQKVFRSPTFPNVLTKINNDILTELSLSQKQKWGLN